MRPERKGRYERVVHDYAYHPMLEMFRFKICVIENKSFFSLLNLSELFLSMIFHSNFTPR